ncbi:alpha/beta fold hydrolase [Luteibacter sahnii]|uniref:alpha/beta fold hydrolase n=1 Tax=Luteibacter sahnii TaxID=3021977 RepID=UPI002A6A5986|nr:alpha/beta hydrolase [Luteibacter sp. PPL193]MDY1547086.1 alpha/beta hydrolase [Luteibacter sp. PPL193]
MHLRTAHPWLKRVLAAGASFLSWAVHATPPVRDVVLVHGAFTDGSSWSTVISGLQRDGYRVTAVQNPLTSLADDVAATQRVLARQGGDVVLVGHSWGGAVVTEAGNAANVKAIVYLSALVPDSGESVATLLKRLDAPMTGMTPDSDGLLWLTDPDAYRRTMAGDLPKGRVEHLASVAPPIAASAFDDSVSHAAWRDKPAWYLVTVGDGALPSNVQRAIAERIHAQTSSVASSHLSPVSHPMAVVKLIEKAANAVSR